MYSGIVYGHLYINCMDGRLFMETGKGLMNEAVYVLSGYESALMDNCQDRLWAYCLGVIFILRLTQVN